MNGTSIDYDDDYIKKLEEIQGESFVQTVGLIVFFVYLAVLLFGVPGNIYVLCRLYKLAKDDAEKYTNGTGSGLVVMATADLLSLLFISLQNILTGISFNIDHWISSLLCKVLVFTTHTVTSISIWSWLLMSTLRYLAVRHPLFHLRLWRAPNRAITVIICMSSVTNLWLLIAIDHGPSSCTQNPLNQDGSLNRWLHLMECLWSFCLPVAVIVYMDAMVLVCRPLEVRRKHRSKLMRNARMRYKAKPALWKWLTISFIDALLNAPENLYRLFILCGIMPAAIPNVYNFSARMIAQVLYFSQFAFNAVYLAVFVYDKNIQPRTIISASTNSCTSIEKPTIFRQESPTPMSYRNRREHRYQSQKEVRYITMAQFRRRSVTQTDIALIKCKNSMTVEIELQHALCTEK